MSNIKNKPKLTSSQLVQKMKTDKGITFNFFSETRAKKYLFNENNYLRTAAYRKNYQKYLNGQNKGKYINLDFGYLKELPEIDALLLLKMLKNLRNACAHNNCIIADLQTGITFVPGELGNFLATIKTISKQQRQKKMSCLPVLEFVSVVYSLRTVASKSIVTKHKRELKKLFEKRMIKHKDYFIGNDIIKSNYEFALKIFHAM